ncbi:MAG: glycosyltransferase [Bacteroidota bacterium]
MKIGIFETEHFEGSYPVIKLFDNNINDITVFTYSNAYKQFQHLFATDQDKYKWIVKPDKRSKYGFIRDMFREIRKRKMNVVYLNTISDNFFFYAIMIFFLRNTRVIVTIHSINSYFEYKKSFSLRRMIRYIGRKMLVSFVKEFNVVSMTMVSHLQHKLPAGKKVHCVPGAVFEETFCIQAQPGIREHINIVIPGSVDDRRRNYEHAFMLLHLFEREKTPVTITFLGRFYSDYGKLILEKCKAEQLEYAHLNYYEYDTVDQPEFDRVMNEASFVFIPSVINTIIEDGVRMFMEQVYHPVTSLI